jgi:hypothetical protein
MDLIGQRIIKEKLGRKLIVPAVGTLGADRKVDVDRPARIPPRVNGLELNGAVCIRELVAAQEILPGGIKSLIGNP